MLRKTMLDECKGERLEEVLAVFSATVLKKVVAQQQLNSREHPPIAHTIALEYKGYTGERTELNTLVLAHKVSLKNKLGRKNAARVQYGNLAELLDIKEQKIGKRREHIQETARDLDATRPSDSDRSRVRRAVRNNWTGNEHWMDALLYGDANTTKDGVLAAPFDRVWRRVRSDRLSELDDKTGGLLEQLDSRVRAQRERLCKWQSFREEMFGDVRDEPQIEVGEKLGRQKGLDFGFGAHESLQLGHTITPRVTDENSWKPRGGYAELLSGLDADLKDINRVSTAPSFVRLGRGARSFQSSQQRSSSEKAPDEPISELSELEDELSKEPVAPTSGVRGASSRQGAEEVMESEATSKRSQKLTRPKLPQPLSTMHAFLPKSELTEISPTESMEPQPAAQQKPSSSSRSAVHDVKDQFTAPAPVRSPTQSNPPAAPRSPSPNSPPRQTQSPGELPPSPTQQQADQILASINDASPSPIKQPMPRRTLSLADRTRLSLSRGVNMDFDEDNDGLPSVSPTRARRRNTSSRSPKKNMPTTPTISEGMTSGDYSGATNSNTAEENDLVARTRKSMANFEAAQQKARLERQRSLKHAAKKSGSLARQTYFPSVDEDGEGGENSTVVLEELIAKETESQGADYESIFKSRPKIKTSPPSTPVRSGFSWEENE